MEVTSFPLPILISLRKRERDSKEFPIFLFVTHNVGDLEEIARRIFDIPRIYPVFLNYQILARKTPINMCFKDCETIMVSVGKSFRNTL